MHRNTGTKTEPVIVEYGFLDSSLDDVNQLKNNWRRYTEAVVDALLTYIKLDQSLTYTVKNGDSLYSIAQKFNTSVDNLIKLNNLKTNNLQIGQVLSVPETIEVDDDTTYTVKSGDSLYTIAAKYNTTVNEIKQLNNLTSNLLSIGQKLKIPTEISKEEEIYTVVSGDSLYSIAQKFNTTVDSIKSLNNLTSNSLSIGQKLKLPISNTNITSPNTYIVQKGDTLYSIAQKFNTTVQQIISTNNLSSNVLNLNQELIIPTSGNLQQQSTYTVKSGDSLWSIAKKLNTTVDNLKSKNNLTNNTLSIGQKLIY